MILNKVVAQCNHQITTIAENMINILMFLSFLFLLGQPAGAIANTTTSVAPTQEKQKSPTSAPRNKTRAKKGKGKGKAKPEPPEETDPRKLELIRWVRVGFIRKFLISD